MGAKHYTALGEQIDMAALAARNSSTVALGNARMNARGDVLGTGGSVLRTQEQIEEEWRKAKEMKDASVGISQNIKSPFPSDAPPGARVVDESDRDFDPTVVLTPQEAAKQQQAAQQPRRRKIVEAD